MLGRCFETREPITGCVCGSGLEKKLSKPKYNIREWLLSHAQCRGISSDDLRAKFLGIFREALYFFVPGAFQNRERLVGASKCGQFEARISLKCVMKLNESTVSEIASLFTSMPLPCVLRCLPTLPRYANIQIAIAAPFLQSEPK